MIILTFGLSESEVGHAVKQIITALSLGHPKYSVASLPPISIYNDVGNLEDEDGRALWLPGFEGVRKDTDKISQLSKDLGFPVTFVDAPVLAAIAGTIY